MACSQECRLTVSGGRAEGNSEVTRALVSCGGEVKATQGKLQLAVERVRTPPEAGSSGHQNPRYAASPRVEAVTLCSH